MKKLICKTCGKEFCDNLEAAEHAMKEKHYTFKLEGTRLILGFA